MNVLNSKHEAILDKTTDKLMKLFDKSKRTGDDISYLDLRVTLSEDFLELINLTETTIRKKHINRIKNEIENIL